MEIRVGQETIGKTGQLGAVRRIVLNDRSHSLEAIVVKPHSLLGSEHIVSIGHVLREDAGALELDIDAAEFKALPSHLDAPPLDRDVDYAAPLSSERDLNATGIPLETGDAISGELILGANKLPTISEGTRVLDVSGAKVGEVDSISMDSITARPTRLKVRMGFVRKRTGDIPPGWVGRVSLGGIDLTVDKRLIEALAA